MSSAYVSGRVPARYERLVSKQARAARTSKSNLVARYVIEKSLETEFPGISFRDSLSGREAYLTGHRVAVWEVLAVHQETKSAEKTASHFRWPRISSSERWRTPRLSPKKSTQPVTKSPPQPRLLADENTSHRFISACKRFLRDFPVVHIAQWQDGSWLGLDDAALLMSCAEARFGTGRLRPRNTPVARGPGAPRGGKSRRPHPVPPHRSEYNYGDQSRLATDFWIREGRAWDWTNQIVYLPKSP